MEIYRDQGSGVRDQGSDDSFAAAIERGEVPEGGFHHRDHLRLAWIYVRRYGREEAGARIAETIRRFAAHHGQSAKYHETMTQAWLLLVAGAPGASFEEAMAGRPELLDKEYLATYYSAGLLASEEARLRFVTPDIAPLS
jgi:hypothetical protein